jgi:outer membrane protein TolC
LAGDQNGDIVIAYQRTLEANAVQQLAAARSLPNLNGGSNFDGHSGALQQSSGNILNVTRDSLYLGAGSNAVAAGSVSVPGVQYNLNVSDSIFNYLVTRPQIERARWLAQATTNDLQLRVALAYGELLRADGRRAIVEESRDNAAEVARVTAAFSVTGEGRDSDAQRAATELERREADLLEARAAVIAASADLVEQLNLQSSIRLRPAEPWVVPRSIVPDPIPLNELVATAIYRRPELAAQRAAIHAALLRLQASRALPFSPQILAGYSGGMFGGGSNIISDNPLGNGAPLGTPRFGDFANRTDTDVAAYWTMQNLGLGNRAQIQTARALLRGAELEQLIVLNQVRAEVADAYARKQTHLALLQFRQQAVESSQAAYDQDLRRVRAAEGLPLEVLDSLRLVYRSREDYLNAIVDYNEAQFALYTAMGQPPANLLVRPAGSGFNPAGDKSPPGATP